MPDKYEELYKLSKETFAGEQQRFYRLDAKAFSYLTALTFLIGFSAPFGIKFFGALIPPTTLSAWLMLDLMILSMATMIIAWFIAFSVVTVTNIPSLPLDSGVIAFFKGNSMVDIHYAMSKGYSREWEKLLKINERKANRMAQTHLAIRFNVVIITLVFLIGFLRAWGLPSMERRSLVTPTTISELSASTTNSNTTAR